MNAETPISQKFLDDMYEINCMIVQGEYEYQDLRNDRAQLEEMAARTNAIRSMPIMSEVLAELSDTIEKIGTELERLRLNRETMIEYTMATAKFEE